ncbi:MAG: hypothetical protein AAF456_14235 [Planctomycetota bacterium]
MTDNQNAKQETRKPFAIPPGIKRMLSRLRSQVRRYVALQSVSAVLIWIVFTFWLVLALDYLPVTFGFDELSVAARVFLLAVAGSGTVWILWRYLLNRIFVPLSDSSMALLLERNNPEFGESLITTVDAANAQATQSASCDRAMLDAAVSRAESVSRRVEVNRALNPAPLRRLLVIATVLTLSVAAFAALRLDAFRIAAGRIYGLTETRWPRSCQLEMIGMKVQRENPVDGIAELGQITMPDEDGRLFVARGSSITILIRAASDSDGVNKPPDSCTLFYYDQEGNRGRQSLKRVGVPRDGYQLYSIDGAPLDGILDDLTVTIRGGDHRIGPYSIEVVDWPVVVSTQLDCVFPEYMVDEESMRWTPRSIAWTGRAQLPQGTGIVLRSESNKQLEKAYVVDGNALTIEEVPANGTFFELPLAPLDETCNFEVYLCDNQGIVSEEPYSISIEPIADQPPVVRTSLAGIGTAVTPDVDIPVSGSLTDDYGVARQWIEIETPITNTLIEQLDNLSGIVNRNIDFRRLRQQSEAGLTLPAGDGNQLKITVMAADAYDLESGEAEGAGPNIGVGDEYVLDIVSPGELLKILERLEVGQRRRLEQIYSELLDARDYLVRSRSTLSQNTEAAEPGDVTRAGGSSSVEENEIRDEELRLLFVRRTLVQIDKSAQEVNGVADSFEHIRLQLINNRIDSEDRKSRLQNEIVEPLRAVGTGLSSELRESVADVELALQELQRLPGNETLSVNADNQADLAIEEADRLLADIDSILSILVKYETQNELLDIVRRMIATQEELNARTEKERKRQQFRGLLDD